MANFFLIDHSLREPGGHHADYTQCVAQAASQIGFETTVGTHTKLGACEQIDGLGKVKRVFRETTYQRDSHLSGLRHLTRAKFDMTKAGEAKQSWARIQNYFQRRVHNKRREKFIQKFAVDCERFFDSTLFTDGDHAFFTTVSELELLALSAFLSNHPRTLQVHWHLQFHFNLFEGRTPEYQEQSERLKIVQKCFDIALSRIPYHALYFYTTSETLADQYNTLGVGNFSVLPYPVSPAFENEAPETIKFSTGVQISTDAQDHGDSKRPIRLTCPGAIRREKGQLDYLQPLVDELWEDYLKPGRAQVVLQRSHSSKLELSLPGDSESAVDYEMHPLPENDYVDFIRSADCGLLFYDSRAYFSRRAGVFGELLSNGKPVVVSPGSWLSDQLQDPNYLHAKELESRFGAREIPLSSLTTEASNVPLPGGIRSFDQFRHPFKLAGARMANELGVVFNFDWHWPQEHGVYARIEMLQIDGDGNVLKTDRSVLGRRRHQANEKVAFRFVKNAVKFEIRIRNAFHNSMASVRNLRLTTLVSSVDLPMGAVGIVAADQEYLSECVSELIEHYDHYRESAEKFSVFWRRQHQPRRTVAHIISSEKTSYRAA